jgi:nucleotide-binding universal stress UspA family protein
MAVTKSIPALRSNPPAIRLKRILVTTDFSDASRQALPPAIEFAGQFGSALVLVHVIPAALLGELSHMGIVFEQKRLAADALARLERFRETELPARLRVETALLEGSPAHQIVTFAKETEADLILIATHGLTGLKHFWLGSTAERVVHHAPCPVLVVREPPVSVRFPGDVLCRFQRILVPTDFSEASQPALRYAAALARPCGGEVTCMHVIEPPPYPEFGYAHVPTKEAALRREAIKKLDVCCHDLSQAGIKTHSVLRNGSAFREIAEQVREHGADLILIGTHGRGAVAHALFGSTAERVVRHAPCPVLVVRERERDFVKE